MSAVNKLNKLISFYIFHFLYYGIVIYNLILFKYFIKYTTSMSNFECQPMSRRH